MKGSAGSMIVANEKLPEGKFIAPVVTIGNFDGVHLGHRAVFDEVIRIAHNAGHPAVVVSFCVHPRKILFPERPVALLTTCGEKIALIGESQIDALVLLDFTPELSQMHAREFVRKVLIERMGASHIVLGYDHAFGKNREGNVDSLGELARICGFEVTRLDSLVIDGHPVSSSRIRSLLEEGDVGMASRYLGRAYSVSGTVVEGLKRGRTIGFPTANLSADDPEKIIPCDGVYATLVSTGDGVSYKAVTNVGPNPTFNGAGRTIESHILDFTGDLYGKKLTIDFISRVRDEKKFPSIEALVDAIRQDVRVTKEVL
ncbi:MAG TPA: bifunctional riboflavin kinase/FAD synthetase [Spirochaetota bacterium]